MYLMTKGRKQYKKDTAIGYIICICALFVLGTIQLATNTKYYEMMWIDDRNFPGGPIAFFTTQFSVPINTVGGVAFILADFLADAILVSSLFYGAILQAMSNRDCYRSIAFSSSVTVACL